MASYTVATGLRKTLSTTTVDTVTFGPVPAGARYVIDNEDDTNALTVTLDGTTPTAGGDNMFYVAPGKAREFINSRGDNKTITIKIIGNGGTYSVQLV